MCVFVLGLSLNLKERMVECVRRHVDPAHVGRTLTHEHAAQWQHCLACKGRGRARWTQRHAQHGQAHVFHLVARL